MRPWDRDEAIVECVELGCGELLELGDVRLELGDSDEADLLGRQVLLESRQIRPGAVLR